MGIGMNNPLQLKSLNHISLVCRSVEKSLNFYQHVLGFFPIRRPGSFDFDFDGAWLFGYGIGIHLLQSGDPESMSKISEINHKDNHISFQVRLRPTLPPNYPIQHFHREIVKNRG
ncbi:unnamed protein product [Linum tenue]|uniref:Glyoxalase/fosfomycin resistance/dioxygenase domain-containing protein n=1 Tax=Linum tenue TaxID=586396 RepID=A0AAV0IUF3_9ROSI|nr:unnamed protein product [Linum tenue]